MLDGNPDLKKKECFLKVDFDEKIVFGWILKKGWKFWAAMNCLKIKNSGGASVNMIVKFVLNEILIIIICLRKILVHIVR